MFKKLFVLSCLLLLAVPAFSTVYLVEPVDSELSQGSEVSFGKLASGETLRIVIKKKSSLSMEWNSLAVDTALLPEGWSFESEKTDKTIIGLLSISPNAPTSTQRLKFSASNSSEPMLSESFFANFSVNESLLDASLESQNLETFLGKEAIFRIVLSNGSISEHAFSVESTLPHYWFPPLLQTIGPNQTLVVELPVRPYSYGEKGFQFTVSSQENGEQFSFPARLTTRPTLSGMFKAPIAGFPFFSPGNLPFYLVNGFLMLLG